MRAFNKKTSDQSHFVCRAPQTAAAMAAAAAATQGVEWGRELKRQQRKQQGLTHAEQQVGAASTQGHEPQTIHRHSSMMNKQTNKTLRCGMTSYSSAVRTSRLDQGKAETRIMSESSVVAASSGSSRGYTDSSKVLGPRQ